MRRRGLTLGLLAAIAAASAPNAAGAPQPVPPPAPVIAVIESSGTNVLHSDFRLTPGEMLSLPPAMPKPRWVSLPSSGSFQARLRAAERGPLGSLEPGRLYWIRGTRIGVFVPKGSRVTNVFEERDHATGTVSAAIGSKHGTNPDAIAIIVPDKSPRAWQWLAAQSWIDIVSTSYYTVFDSGAGTRATCPEHRYIKEIAESGRLVFTSSGNVEQAGAANTPSGSPYSYQVGGVADDGRTYVPGVGGDEASITPTRPYETGDRFDFLVADAASLHGSMDFGGTSGATPSTAGRAAELLVFARRILGSAATGAREGALAIATSTAKLPRRGPLADGRLEAGEFTDLLHHVAIPAERETPTRYLVEGYGALNDSAVEKAKRVLSGKAAEPARPQEDAMHAAVERARAVLFPTGRCG